MLYDVKYTEKDILSFLNDDVVVTQAYKEFLMVSVSDMNGGNRIFLNAYRTFRRALFERFLSDNSKKNVKIDPTHWLMLIMKLLPKVKKDSARISHGDITDVKMAAGRSYNEYATRDDVAEIYAAYLLYIYSQLQQPIDHEWDEELKACEEKRDILLSCLRVYIVDAAPFTGPKLELFSVAAKNEKYLDDDIGNVGDGEVSARFFLACGRKDHRMTYKLLGELRRVEPEGIDYYEGLADYSDEQYEDAVHYLCKVDQTSEYYGEAKMLLVECYAMLGKEDLYFKLLNQKDGVPASYDYIAYTTQLLIRNAKKTSGNIYQKAKKARNSGKEELSYRSKVRMNSFLAMIEGANLLHDYESHKTINEQLEFSKDQQKTLEDCNKIIQFFMGGQELFFVGNNRRAMCYGWSVLQIEGGILRSIRDKYVGTEGSPPTCPNLKIEETLFAYEAMYRLGMYEAFHIQVGYHLEWFKSVSFMDEAVNLLKKAYIEGLAIKKPNQKLMEYVKKNFIDIESASRDEITKSRMRAVLPANCFIAFEAAEWQYQKSRESDYGWKDAGMISLSYFRIVEITINQKLISKVADRVGDTVRTLLHETRNDMSERKKRQYNEKWGRIVNTLHDMHGGSENGLMLGDLEKFFVNLGSKYDPEDEIAVILRNSLEEHLTDLGKKMILEELYMENAISGDNRIKYRNPPAHCKYLAYDTACECRDFTCSLLFDFCMFIKDIEESPKESGKN